eukprot:m.354461 g.354461  ORF g.354461 m.354461 type:complete len:117 (+) comp17030_c0_seq1:381-731(+)
MEPPPKYEYQTPSAPPAQPQMQNNQQSQYQPPPAQLPQAGNPYARQQAPSYAEATAVVYTQSTPLIVRPVRTVIVSNRRRRTLIFMLIFIFCFILPLIIVGNTVWWDDDDYVDDDY